MKHLRLGFRRVLSLNTAALGVLDLVIGFFGARLSNLEGGNDRVFYFEVLVISETLLSYYRHSMSQFLMLYPLITAALLSPRLRVRPRVAGVVNMTSPALHHPFFSTRDMACAV